MNSATAGPQEGGRRSLGTVILPLLVAVVALLWLGGLSRFVLPDEAFRKYPEAAALHLNGELDPERLADFSPLYFELHVLLARLAGPEGQPQELVRDLQILISAGSSALLFLLLRRHLPLWTALTATAAFLLDPALIVYTPVLEPEPLLLFCVLALLLLSERSRPLPALAAGLFCAAGVLLRPTLLPALVLVPLAYRLRGRRRWWRYGLLFALPILLALAALSARNHNAFGSRSPTVMNPGTVFYEGNNPLSWGLSAIYPPILHLVDPYALGSQPDVAHVLYRRLARSATGEELSVAEVNAYWVRKSLAFARDHPLRQLRLLLAKVRVLLRSAPEHDVRSAWLAEQVLRARHVPLAPFSLIAASALLGMLVVGRTGRELDHSTRTLPGLRRHFLVYALLACQVAAMLALYVSARQRLTTLPVFLFFAAFAWSWLARQERRAWLWLALLVALAAGLSLRNDLDRDREHLNRQTAVAVRMSREAQAMRDAGRLEEASAMAARALTEAPWALDRLRPAGLPYGERGYAGTAADLAQASGAPADASSLFDRALLLRAAGEIDAAERMLAALPPGTRFARSGKYASSPRFLAAVLALDRGDEERAIGLLRQALTETPGDPFTLAQLAIVTGDLEAEQQLRRYFDDLSADFFLGRAAFELDRRERAWELLSRVSARFPDFAPAWIYLAASTAGDERLAEGTAAYLRGVAVQSEPVLLETPILDLFAAHHRARPDDPWAALFYAQVLHQFGHYRQALSLLQTLPAGGDHARARAHTLDLIRRLGPAAMDEGG